MNLITQSYFIICSINFIFRDVVTLKLISKPNEKVKTESVSTATKRSLKYPSLESVNGFDVNSETYIKRKKKSGPGFLVMKILQMFRENESRDPHPSTRKEDIAKLLKLRNDLSTAEIIPDVYFDHVFAQIAPSAAIVGGAIGHEIIKAVSQTEAPHFNHFFFDAQTCCGFIESIEA